MTELTEERVREIVAEMIAGASWDGPGMTGLDPALDPTTFDKSGLNDGWSDQIHPRGGFWSQGVIEYANEVRSLSGRHVEALLDHPYLNAAWVANFSQERIDYMKETYPDVAPQSFTNLSHYNFMDLTIPGGGRPPRRTSRYSHTLTIPQAYTWDIRTNPSGGFAGADPGDSDPTCLVFLIDAPDDSAITLAIRQFGQNFLSKGPFRFDPYLGFKPRGGGVR